MVEGTLASEEFQGFLQDEGIDLSDLTTVTSPEAKSRIKRELGIDVDKKNAQSKLNKSIPGGTTSGNTWRRIVSEWQTYDEASKTYLIGIHESAGPDEQDILTFMEDHRHEIEEDLGRTLFACQMKMGEMGLIQPPVEFGPANGGYREHIYPFPTLHQDTERRIELGFRNKAYLLEKGLAPDVVPVFAYGSHAKYDDGTPQSVRITTPIKYKGSDISKYTPYEQSVLATLQGYVLDPESFQKSGQSIKGKPTTDGLRILAREREDGTQYTQLSLKSRFSSNSQVIDTNALKLGNGVEVYLFKHDQADVTQENTRGLTE